MLVWRTRTLCIDFNDEIHGVVADSRTLNFSNNIDLCYFDLCIIYKGRSNLGTFCFSVCPSNSGVICTPLNLVFQA